jgi:hypothetical protein
MQGLGFPLLYMVMSVHGSLLTDQKLKLEDANTVNKDISSVYNY